jgi:hypothetical protein
MSDPTLDFLSSGGGAAPVSSGDATQDFLASGGESLPDQPAAPAPVYGKTLKEAGGDLALRGVSNIGANILAGGRAMYDLATGSSLADADIRAQKSIQEHTYQPKDALSQGLAKAADSKVNPLNWPGLAINKASDVMGEQVGPGAAGATTGVLQGALALTALKGGMEPLSGTPAKGFRVPPSAAAAPTAASAPAELTASAPPRAAPFEPQDVPNAPGVKVDTEPVEGGLPKAAHGERAQILQRVGLENARDSALKGDAKTAATDFQVSKFDEPTGVAAKAQFDAERAALAKHSEGIVQKTGGTLGTDEDTVNARGQTIAQPFDALSKWFDTQRKGLYAEADKKAGGAPVTKLEGVDALLQDPKFRNTLLAKDQGNLLTSIGNQLDEFRKQSPNGFNVAGAEDVRKWMNQIWTNDNKHAIGQVKDALDEDVLKGAGEDIYGPARALVQMKKQTLDNPSGINKLMEHDPQTPINRTTSFDKIPDTLTRLAPAQFDQVLKTLDAMPPEIQPLAQSAKAEIKAHLANKIHDAGNSTQGQWNAPGVEKVIKANSAKLQSAFADQPELLGAISDLRSAGKILRVDQSYPGAAAQAANAVKRGLMSRSLGRIGATVGGGTGSILGPLGAAGGAVLGEAGGSALGGAMSERAALKNWQNKISRLSDVAK